MTDLGGDPMVEGGGVGLLPALCLLRIAWVRLTLLTDSCLFPSSGPKAGDELSVTSIQFDLTVSSTESDKAASKHNHAMP